MLGITLPAPLNERGRCPHLGLPDDADTALDYPSVWNCCHYVKAAAPPNLNHQRRVCLTVGYADCPVLNAQQKKTLPKNLRMTNAGKSRKIFWRWAATIFVLLFLLLSSLVLAGRFPVVDGLSIPFLSSRPTLEGLETNTVGPIDTDTPPASVTAVVPSKVSDIVTPSLTESVLLCAYPMETIIGDKSLIVHRIVAGESLTILARRYDTSEAAIADVNYFLPSPLWAELAIVIPVATSDVGGLPSLKPVFVEEKNSSPEQLARVLSVSVSDLIELNQIDTTCQSFYGWIVIPAEKISP